MLMTIVTLMLLVFTDGCTLIPAEWKFVPLVGIGSVIVSYSSQKLVGHLREVLA